MKKNLYFFSLLPLILLFGFTTSKKQKVKNPLIKLVNDIYKEDSLQKINQFVNDKFCSKNYPVTSEFDCRLSKKLVKKFKAKRVFYLVEHREYDSDFDRKKFVAVHLHLVAYGKWEKREKRRTRVNSDFKKLASLLQKDYEIKEKMFQEGGEEPDEEIIIFNSKNSESLIELNKRFGGCLSWTEIFITIYKPI